mmetsp:Transcript_8684/g.26016  ORF Transcript_8684/g.26016 Transcript_8684/m.26016 type:complete len:83 (+) Transcript_8684:78-326(+)
MTPGGGTANGSLSWFLCEGGLPRHTRGVGRAGAALPFKVTTRDTTGKRIVAQDPGAVFGASARGKRDGMGAGVLALHLRRRC